MDRFGSLMHFVEPVSFFYFMTISIEVSAVQQLIRRKVCLLKDLPDCSGKASPELINASSPWIGFYNIALSTVTLMTGLWFGSWADKYGRKKMMVLPSIGGILSSVNFIAQSHFMKATPMYLMVSALIVGLSAGSLGVTSTCFGLISEVTSPERRSSRIAMMEATIFTGGALGFYIVGYCLPKTSFIAVFTFELFVHSSVLLYIVNVVREPERSRQLDMSTTPMRSLQHIVSMYRTVTRPREQNYRLAVLLLMASSLMLSFGLAATYQFTYTLLTSPPLSWSGKEYSTFHGLMLAVQGSFLIVALPVCLRLFGMKDTTAGFLGTLSRTLGLAALSLATESWIAFVALALYSMSEFSMPSIRSILSKIVGPNEKCQIFAFMSTQSSLAFLTTGILFLIPGSTTAVFPGLGMAIAAGLQVVPLGSLLYLYFALDLSTVSTSPYPDDQSEHLCSTEDSVTAP